MKNNKERFKIEIVKKKKKQSKPKTAQAPRTHTNTEKMPESLTKQSSDLSRIRKYLPQIINAHDEENKGFFHNKKLARIAKSRRSLPQRDIQRQGQLSPKMQNYQSCNTYAIDDNFMNQCIRFSEFLQESQLHSPQQNNNFRYLESGKQKKITQQSQPWHKGFKNRNVSQKKIHQRGKSQVVHLLESLKKGQSLHSNRNSQNLNQLADLTGIRCQSITLLSAPPSKKTNQPLIPSKLLKSRQSYESPSRKKIRVNKITTSSVVSGSNKIMSFNMSMDPDIVYLKKLKAYLDFLFKINFSNKMYIQFSLKENMGERQNSLERFKIFIGPNNNSQIVKNTLKKRFWFQVIDLDTNQLEDPKFFETNKNCFFWTTGSANQIFKRQNRSGSILSSHPNAISKILPEKKGNRVTSSQLLKIQSSAPITFSYSPTKSEKKNWDQIENENYKILSAQDVFQVEDYILMDGHIMPYEPTSRENIMITNHLPYNNCLGEKTKLFKTMFHFYKNFRKSDPFDILPVTYTVRNCDDPEFKRFLRDNESKKKMGESSIWIVKPGEDTNRGYGIKLAMVQDIGGIIKESKGRQTYIIQSYIDRPLLYYGRKFDIRHFLLVTSVNGFVKGYWLKEGYIRTSSQNFNTNKQDLGNSFIHLTNDAIQKQSPNYGKYQPANKLSYVEFQRYLDTLKLDKKIEFQAQIVNKNMKNIIYDVLLASYSTIDFERKSSNFQLFGLDFMLDRNMKPWLIQINSNPCLETNCPLLNRMIPNILQICFRIGLDPLMPPLCHFAAKHRPFLAQNYLKNLKAELIFDECALKNAIAINYDILEIQQEEQQLF